MANNLRRHDIDYVRAVLEGGSFLAATEILHLTQPAISQYIAKIERENGIQLFNRSVRPVTLTGEGRYWLEIEEKIEELKSRRLRFFSDEGGQVSGRLRIGTNQCRTAVILGEALREFVQRYPSVEPELVEGGMQEIDQRMLRGDLDFSLTLEALLTPQMACRTLLDENILIAFPPGHPLGERARRAQAEGRSGYLPFHFPDAAGEKFILLNRGLKFHDGFYELCRKYRLSPRVLMSTESITTVLELINQGVGCGMVPDSLVLAQKTQSGAAFYSLQNEFPRNRVVAAWNKDLYLSKAARAFIELLAQKHRHLCSEP